MSKVIRAVVGIGLFVAGVFMGGTTWPLAVMALGGGLAASAITPKIETPAVSEATGGRLNADLQPEAYRKIPLGVTAMATDTRYWEVSGPDQKKYDQVIALAGCKITSLDAIYIEDELVTFDGSGNAVGKYAGALSRSFSLEGVTGQALAGVGTGTRWNAASGEAASMTGVAHLVLKWAWSQEKLPRGFPTRITPEGKGSPVYDPRRDSTRGGSGSHRADDQSTWEFTPLDSNGEPIGRNAALEILRYLIGWRIENPSTGEMVLVDGMGVDLDDINFDEFIQAANDCETEEYYADCLLSTGDTHATNLAVLEQACAGKVSDAGGRYGLRIQVDDFAGDAIEFTDSDIVGECDWRPEMPLAQSAYNQVSAQFVDPAALYQLRSAPLVRDAVYEAADGAKERTNVRLDAVQDGEQAQKLARLMLNKSRRKGVFEAPFGWRAVNVKVGQPVKLTLSRFGFDQRWFRVRATKVDPGGAVWMALEDDDPSVYAGGTVSPVPPAATGAGYDPLSVLPPDPDDWTITVGGPAIGQPGGPAIVVKPEPSVASLTALRSVLVHIRLHGLDPEAVWTLYGEFALATLESIEITGLFPNMAYEVRLQYRNGHGAIDPQSTQVFGPITTGGLTASDVGGLTRAQLEESLAFLASVNPALAGGLGIREQAGYINLFTDPLFALGVGDVRSQQGIVDLTDGAPRAAGVTVTLPTGADVALVLGPRFDLRSGARLAAACEVSASGSISDAALSAHFYDASGDEIGAGVTIASGVADGERAAGFVESSDIPSTTAQVELRLAGVSDGTGEGRLAASELLAAYTAPQQSSVPAFVDPKDETVSRALDLLRVDVERAYQLAGLEYETSVSRALITVLQEVTANAARYQIATQYETQGGETLSLIELLAADGESRILLLSGLLAFANTVVDGDPLVAMEVRNGIVHFLTEARLAEGGAFTHYTGDPAVLRICLGAHPDTGDIGIFLYDDAGDPLLEFNATDNVAKLYPGMAAEGFASLQTSGSRSDYDLTTDSSPRNPADFIDLSVATTGALPLVVNARYEIEVDYTIVAERDSFEWFTFVDQVLIEARTGGGAWTTVKDFGDVDQYFSTSSNTGQVPTNIGSTRTVPKRIQFVNEWVGAGVYDEVRAVLEIRADALGGASGCLYGSPNDTKITNSLKIAQARIKLIRPTPGPNAIL